jgi:hypothetical protein
MNKFKYNICIKGTNRKFKYIVLLLLGGNSLVISNGKKRKRGEEEKIRYFLVSRYKPGSRGEEKNKKMRSREDQQL